MEQHECTKDDSISITKRIDQVMSLFQDQSRPPAALIDFKLEELLDYETMEEDQVLTHYTQVTILMYSNLNVIVISGKCRKSLGATCHMVFVSSKCLVCDKCLVRS